MFAIYLDDSYTNAGTNLCIAGYYSHLNRWAAYEAEVCPVYEQYGVSILRGKDIHDGHKCFKGWDGSRKLSFVEDVFNIASKHVYTGRVSGINQKWFSNERKQGQLNYASVSSLGFAFSSIITSLSRGFPGRAALIEEGVTFFVESGNRNNSNIEKFFQLAKSESIFSMTDKCALLFVDKASCKAIHLADMLAFFGRRAMDYGDNASKVLNETDPIYRIMMGRIHCDFNQLDAGGTPYTGGVAFGPIKGF